MNTRHPSVSLAIPVYNEEAVVPELLRRTTAVLDNLPGGPHEIVFANDGGSDRTLEFLEKAAETDDRLVVVALSRNFGHQIAFTAALDHVKGDVAVLMDGDLQDPPEAIPQLVDAYQQGYDVVYVRRVNRKESWWLRFCYYMFYRILAALSSTQLPLDSGDFGLISRRVIEELRRMPEHDRYLRGMRTWVGFRQIGVPVERSARHLAPGGKIVLNVPAGQWAYSEYDRAAGQVRRYSIATLRETGLRCGVRVQRWTYWGLPLVPTLAVPRDTRRNSYLAGTREKLTANGAEDEGPDGGDGLEVCNQRRRGRKR